MYHNHDKKAVLSQGKRAMKQLLLWFKVRRQHSSQASKARLQSSKPTGAKHNLTHSGHFVI